MLAWRETILNRGVVKYRNDRISSFIRTVIIWNTSSSSFIMIIFDALESRIKSIYSSNHLVHLSCFFFKRLLLVINYNLNYSLNYMRCLKSLDNSIEIAIWEARAKAFETHLNERKNQMKWFPASWISSTVGLSVANVSTYQ